MTNEILETFPNWISSTSTSIISIGSLKAWNLCFSIFFQVLTFCYFTCLFLVLNENVLYDKIFETISFILSFFLFFISWNVCLGSPCIFLLFLYIIFSCFFLVFTQVISISWRLERWIWTILGQLRKNSKKCPQ